MAHTVLNPVNVVFDVIGREILKRSTELARPGGTLVTIAMVPTVQPRDGRSIFFVVEPDRARLIVRPLGTIFRWRIGGGRVRDRRVVSQPGRGWQLAGCTVTPGTRGICARTFGAAQLCPASGHRNGVSQKLIENSAIPYSIVHATQFFEFVRRMADEATDGSTVRFAPVLFQPIAGDDVAHAVGKIAAGSTLNGKVEVAAPEQFRMDEFFRSALAMRDDPRTVVTDPHASYVGTELGERVLLPGADAILGEIRYSNWPGLTASGK
jgi:hypothetical protein